MFASCDGFDWVSVCGFDSFAVLTIFFSFRVRAAANLMLFAFSVVFWGQALASNIKSHLVRGEHWGSGVGYLLWGFEETSQFCLGGRIYW